MGCVWVPAIYQASIFGLHYAQGHLIVVKKNSADNQQKLLGKVTKAGFNHCTSKSFYTMFNLQGSVCQLAQIRGHVKLNYFSASLGRNPLIEKIHSRSLGELRSQQSAVEMIYTHSVRGISTCLYACMNCVIH